MSKQNAGGPKPIDFPLRVAAVDIGSNAVRFVAAQFSDLDQHRVLDSLRVPVRLGHSAFLTHYLDSELIERTVEALQHFRRRMDDLDVQQVRAVATSAVRESRNGPELVERIREETGIPIDVITGAEEGRLVWRAIGSRVALAGRQWILADLGGGSVEVSLATSDRLDWTESLPLGTVRLLEELGYDPEAPVAPLRRLLEEYTAALRAPVEVAEQVEGMIATGGNAEAIADLTGAVPDDFGVRSFSRSDLHDVLEKIASLTYRERVARLNLREDRADVIFPAAIVYERLAQVTGIETILVPGVGLKEGVLLDLVDHLESGEAR
jgi:exopolyphosphatase / guanosine-5'-triphosphate,3'-diphosphate pyrophosphatase